MTKPRLIYYNDAHHFHAKRIDPPLNLHKLHWPVDEISGTGVELLVLGLGYGDVYFHNSRTGRVVGQKKDVWENFIDWRIMRMVKDARRLKTDQVREVIRRGRENGIPVFPSLKLQDAAQPGGQRCGWLKWKHKMEVCLGGSDEDRETWAYDFTHELVHEDKLAMIREMLEDYQADGLELDFMFYPLYFRKQEIEKNIETMNRFLARIRKLADEIGGSQGRRIPLIARVYHNKDENLKIGLDVETWLEEKSIDMVVGEVHYFLLDTGIRDGQWLADAANRFGASAYIRPPRHIYDERTLVPDIEMWRAFGQSLHWQEFSGMYLGYLPWPLSDAEYRLLREAAFPKAVARHNKRYLLQPREPETPLNTTPPGRQLPAPLNEGEKVNLKIWISDDLDSARRDGEMREPILTIRFSLFCVEDEIEIRFNDEVLPLDKAEITDERALTMPAIPGWYRGEIDAPGGFSAHWFRYRLPIDLLTRGENRIEINPVKFSPAAGFKRSVNGVEIQTRYKDFERPAGLGKETVKPIS